MNNIDEQSLVRFLIGANCVKYDILDELYREINKTDYRMAVLLVDAHSVFGRLYHDKRIASFYAGAREEMIRDLVVGFLNVLGHYRRYMASRLGLDNDIYVVFNRKKPTYNDTYCRGFNETRIERYDPSDPDFGFTTQALTTAWEFIQGLAPYFEGIYCLDNSGIDDYAVFGRMEFDNPDTLVTMLSTNVYGTQLLSKNWVMLHPKRDRSYLITRKTCYKKGILRDLKYEASELLTPEMLPLYWSLVGCRDVNVPNLKLVSPRNLIDGMGQMAADGYLTKETTISGFLENVGTYVSLSVPQLKSSKSRIEDRYKALSARMSALAITSSQLARITAQIYDLENQNELEQLNEILVQGRLDPEIINLENLNMAAGFDPYADHDWGYY